MGSSAQVTFAFLAKDAASSTIRGLSKTLGGLSSVASRVGGALTKAFKAAVVGVGVAIGAASAALAKFTKDAIQDEAAQSRLTAVLKARGIATTENLAAVEESIKAGQKLAFTDDEVRDGISVATQFTKDFTKAQKILATAQDLARAKSIPLEKATTLVGRAYKGNTTALGRMGIEIKKGAKGTAALAGINAKFAGSAEAYSKTTTGSIEALTIQLQEAGESIGTALLPIVNELLGVFIEKGVPIILSVVESIKGFISTNRELIRGVAETVGGIVSNLIPILVTVGEFIFGKVIPAIVGFVEKMTAPGGLSDSIGKVVGPLVDNLIPVVKMVIGNIVKLAGKVGELVGILWDNGNGPLAAAFKGIVGVGTILLGIFGNIVGAIGNAIGAVISIGKAIMDSPIGFIIKAIAGVIGGVAGAVGGAFGMGGGGGSPAGASSTSATGSYGPRVVKNEISINLDGKKVADSVAQNLALTPGATPRGTY